MENDEVMTCINRMKEYVNSLKINVCEEIKKIICNSKSTDNIINSQSFEKLNNILVGIDCLMGTIKEFEYFWRGLHFGF